MLIFSRQACKILKQINPTRFTTWVCCEDTVYTVYDSPTTTHILQNILQNSETKASEYRVKYEEMLLEVLPLH